MLIYLVKENSMLKLFEIVYIEHVIRIHSQEANDLAQVAKQKLKNLTEVKYKLVSTSIIQLEFSKPKLVGAEELPEFCENFETFAIDNIENDDW